MDNATGMLVKIQVNDELWASKNTNIYFDEALTQKAFTIIKDKKIGRVSEVNDKYIEIYFIEDEDNQRLLYFSPKSKTYLLFYHKNTDTTFEENTNEITNESTNESTSKNQVSKVKKSNQWFGNIFSVISESVVAYTNSSKSYEDYVSSDNTYKNYTYVKKSISNNSNSITPQSINNTWVFIAGFTILLLVLIVVFKILNSTNSTY